MSLGDKQPRIDTSTAEAFRLGVASALGSIQANQKTLVAQFTALNETVSEQGQRISRLESAWGTVKAMVVGIIALMAVAASVTIAFLKGDS